MNELVEDLKIANDNLYSANKMLEEENKRLNNIIDKAIEYLKDNACYNDMGNFNDDLDYDKCGDLLDILKGSDKE